MNTHPLLSKGLSALAALALLASLFGALTVSVQQARAATMAEQILCFVDQQLGSNIPFDPQLDYCDGGPGEGEMPQCQDGIDNDNDNKVDQADPGCSGPTDDSESPDPTPTLMQCQDTVDNDNDGVTDLADPDCDSATDNTESGTMGTSTGTTTPPMQCADTIDNDNDGLVDLSDPGCSNAQDNSETNSNGGGNGSTSPMLTIVKHAMGGNGTFNFSVTGGTSASLTTTNGWATSSAMTLGTGTSTITETQMSGWNTTGMSCMKGGQATGSSAGTGAYAVSAQNGDSITCTFTNTATTTGTTTDAALHVDSIDAQDTSAIANDTYADGWRYLFHITAPNNEENLSMRFSDWFVSTTSSSSIPVANNMRISSAQASSTAPITLTGSNVYSTPALILTDDLNPSMPGRQVQVLVEVKIPTSTPNQTFTTVYGVQTLP